ncbi:MAG: hypothetical protein QNJ46_32255 [Leptolyngbyaceae cyanobacterium MO_188.B28]|nr:hypothetical protein [Leptolyngbyaceae cyanobacterium MO_188.B28]
MRQNKVTEKAVDGWMGGWVDGWMGGWVDGWMGGWDDMFLRLSKSGQSSGEGIQNVGRQRILSAGSWILSPDS